MEKNPSSFQRLHILVTGRVQNVGFRAFVQQTAAMLNLMGWVRNIKYDQVEAVAEGERGTLEKFASIVTTGPRGSRVEESKLDWEIASGEYAGFKITYSQ